MAWNKNLPENATKIRLDPSILQANWEAIETGGVPYDYLQLSSQSSDPTRADDTGWLYTKDPGDGIQELFYQDDQDTAKIIQMTQNGSIGSTSTQVNASQITFNTTSGEALNYVDGQFVTAYGYISAAGALSKEKNLENASRISTGVFQFNVTAGVLLNDNFIICATARDDTASGSALRGVEVVSVATVVIANPTTIQVQVRKNDSKVDISFYVMICGGR